MKTGLMAVSVVQGSSVVLRVGWFRPERGGSADDWEAWWVTPYRGEYQTRLSDVWAEGPKKAPRWEWGPVLHAPVSRLHVIPLAYLDPEQWQGVCLKPDGWEE